jgi:BirA family biotin operon repressor/biotin-[acetyl-CoA-carboxylase] ligase
MNEFKFYYFKTVSSTNDKAKSLVNEGEDRIVVVADKQEKGRGRFGRKWSSGLGGLYMTILLKEENLLKVKYLTFMAAVAVAKTIEKLGFSCGVKWPNDVLVSGKKICGILTETVTNKDNNTAVIGIGVNVNQNKFGKDIANKATSLKIESNKSYNIKNISKSIIKEFNDLYQYYTKKNYTQIITIWKRYSCTLGEKIKAKTLSGVYVGEAVDVDKDCNLVLKLDNGKLKKIIEGDIFVV